MATRRHRATASGKGGAGRARTARSADSAADVVTEEDKSRFLREWLSPSDGDDDDSGGGAAGRCGGGEGGSHSMRRLRLGGSGSGGGATDDEAAARAAKMREDPAKRMKAFRTRTFSTVVLIGGFFWVVWAGHVPLMLFVLMLQILIVREAFGLGRMAQEDVKLPWFRAQQWYFFAVTAFYLYLSFISRNLLVEATEKKVLLKALSWVVKRHLMISFFAYCGGFVMFVLSLKRGMYMYQFAQYAWTHMIILMVIMPTSFFVSNMFQGIIWYLLPALMIITNDICAYLAGFFFGRTPLIKLSPKKTWEGFAGGALGTALVAFYASRWLARSQWLTCPRTDLSLGTLHCSPSRIFQDHRFTMRELAVEMPGPLEELLTVLHWVLPEKQWQWLESRTLVLMPMQVCGRGQAQTCTSWKLGRSQPTCIRALHAGRRPACLFDLVLLCSILLPFLPS